MSCTFVPPYLLQRVARRAGTRHASASGRETLQVDDRLRARREARPPEMAAPSLPGASSRVVHSANNTETLPGAVVRGNGDPPVGDLAIDEAFDQLRDYDVAGGVALDVGDCLDDSLLFAHDADRATPPHQAIDTAVDHLYHGVSDYLIDHKMHRINPVVSRIFFVVVYVHGWRWFVKRPQGPELFSATQVGRFVSAKGNLRYWDAERIRLAYAAGLTGTGLYITRETHEIL